MSVIVGEWRWVGFWFKILISYGWVKMWEKCFPEIK